MKRLGILIAIIMAALFLSACIRPDWKYSEPVSLNRKARACFSQGGDLWARGDWKGAIVEYRKAEELDPDNAAIHIRLSWALLWTDDWDGAITEGRTALRLDPNNRKAPEVHGYIGTVLEHKGDLCGALKEYRTGYLIAPVFGKIETDYKRLTDMHLTCPPGQEGKKP
ncbi:MAG: tetratricopeptide repeat protein [Terriglobia bacterium]|jgi:tetratricopeptide (TPR) repeat protein